MCFRMKTVSNLIETYEFSISYKIKTLFSIYYSLNNLFDYRWWRSTRCVRLVLNNNRSNENEGCQRI